MDSTTKDPRPTATARPPLSIDRILKWARTQKARTGDWPSTTSGSVIDVPGEEWSDIDVSLRAGYRGLPGGSSLANLQALYFGRRNKNNLPTLTLETILAWATTHRERTGEWPNTRSGDIVDSPGDTWQNVGLAMYYGTRGLPRGVTLAKLLEERRGVRNLRNPPPLSLEQILYWAKAHRERTGDWPTTRSGRVFDAPGEKWYGINVALATGKRGLPAGTTLARVLSRHLAVDTVRNRPNLSENQIVEWAKVYKRRVGKWPGQRSGDCLEAPGEKWNYFDQALKQGLRGLPGGITLRQLFERRFRLKKARSYSTLTVEQILNWAEAHFRRTGEWPTFRSGPLLGIPNETWKRLNISLRRGGRGLPVTVTLKRLLEDHRGVPRYPLTTEDILRWAKAHFDRTGMWPLTSSGAVTDAPGESWRKINMALYYGSRGLPGKSSLQQLLIAHFQVGDRRGGGGRVPLTEDQILAWIRAYRERHGDWPKSNSGAIDDVPGMTWDRVDSALRNGSRGLAGDSSLSRFLRKHFGVEERRGRPRRSGEL